GMGGGDLRAVELRAGGAGGLAERRRGAEAKSEAAVAKLTGVSDKTHWVHRELASPQCLPQDQTGARQDIVKYANGTVLCETAGKNDWVQVGELIQVGVAWRLADGPSEGLPTMAPPDQPGIDTVEKELQPLLDQLGAWDKEQGKVEAGSPGQNPSVVRYNLGRADILEKVVAQVKPEKREMWIRQVADCLAAAAQASPPADKTAYERLLRLEDQIVKAMPGSSLARAVTV